MIKVIKHGQTEYTTICKRCGCQFSYELSDLKENYINCPDCNNSIQHELLSAYCLQAEAQDCSTEEVKQFIQSLNDINYMVYHNNSLPEVAYNDRLPF